MYILRFKNGEMRQIEYYHQDDVSRVQAGVPKWRRERRHLQGNI